jgi:hypothetical protein
MYNLDLSNDCSGVRGDEEFSKVVDQQLVTTYTADVDCR